MPCKSDYLEPNEKECELARVRALLVELKKGTLPSWYGVGSHPKAYNKSHLLDQKTKLLCKRVKEINPLTIYKYSPEMREWILRHQILDFLRDSAVLDQNGNEVVSLKLLQKFFKNLNLK